MTLDGFEYYVNDEISKLEEKGCAILSIKILGEKEIAGAAIVYGS